MRAASCVLVVLLIASSVPAAEPAEQQFRFHIKVCQGDVSKQHVTKVLSEPTIITIAARPFTLRTGAHVMLPKVPGQPSQAAESGLGIIGKATALDEETVRLELQWQNAEVVTSNEEELEIKTSGQRLSKTVKLGTASTYVLDKNAEKQTWVEVTVTTVETE